MIGDILKKAGLAFLMVAIVLLLANVFRPENALFVGSGFTGSTPAVAYPARFALLSAMIFLISSFILKPRSCRTAWFVLLAINLVYLVYCIRTYVV